MSLSRYLVVFITIFFIGCGSSDTASLISRDDINVITGSVTKGIVTSGVVEAFDEDGKLLGSSEVKDGNYSIKVIYSGKVLLKAKIDQYIDELTENKINVDSLELVAVSFVNQSSAKVFVTPLTTLTYKTLGGSSLKLKNLSLEDINSANIKVAEALNIGKFDVTKEPYNIVTKGDNDLNSTNADKYGLVLASISAESNVTSSYSSSDNKNKVESLIDTLYQNMEKNDTKAISTIIKSGVNKLEIPLDNNNSILTNDAPEASDINTTTNEDTAKTITLTATDIDGDDLNYSIVSTVTHGELNGTAPNLTYTPTADFNGTDSFTYKVSDGKADSNIATVNITISSVNDAPVVSDLNITTAEDSEKNITLSGSDVDGDTLTYSIVSNPTNGDINGTLPNIVYTPHKDFNGTDSFTYKANDGTLDSNTATVTITITNVSDAPVARDINITVDENSQNNEINITATDGDGDSLSYSIDTNVTHGELNTTNAPILTYTPTADFNGTDSFTYKVSDGTNDSNVATVNITVNNVNDAPVANDQNVTLIGENSKTIILTATDPDGDSLTYTVQNPLHGTISGTLPNIIYEPNNNYYGSDSFTFRVNDGKLDSNDATVFISIPAPFVTQWETTSADENITIPAVSGEDYNYTVKWGDDSVDRDIAGSVSHQYDYSGSYIVKIFGDFPRIDFSTTFDTNKAKLKYILSWGDIKWTSMQKAFYSCSELNITATDKPDLSNVTDLSKMFYGAVKVDINVSDWNITQVTDMTDMFKDVNLSVANYDALLNGWASQQVENNITITFGDGTKYSDDANVSRAKLVNDYNWTITDGGWTSN